jgi:hypothetical protein
MPAALSALGDPQVAGAIWRHRFACKIIERFPVLAMIGTLDRRVAWPGEPARTKCQRRRSVGVSQPLVHRQFAIKSPNEVVDALDGQFQPCWIAVA